MLPTASIVNLRKAEAKLSRAKYRFGAGDVKGAGESYRSPETPEDAFGDVKRCLLVSVANGSPLVAGDHHRVSGDDNLHRLGVDSHHVDDDFQAAPRFEHVQRDLAFGWMRLRVIADELIEQPAQLIVHIAAFKKDASHESILSLSGAGFQLSAVSFRLPASCA